MSRKLLYIDIADKIRENILNGTYPVNSLLPTEIEFEEIFNVSKITIRNAIEILANEGYVQKKSGKGTTVISDRLFNKLSKAVSFSSILEEEHELVKDLISFEHLKVANDSELHNIFGEDVLCLKRIYYLDGKPYILFEHYFTYFEVNETEAFNTIKEQSIYRWLANHGYQVASFTDKFKVSTLDIEAQQHLQTTENTCLSRIRESKDPDGKIIEYSIGNYNTEMMPYIIEYEI